MRRGSYRGGGLQKVFSSLLQLPPYPNTATATGFRNEVIVRERRYLSWFLARLVLLAFVLPHHHRVAEQALAPADLTAIVTRSDLRRARAARHRSKLEVLCFLQAFASIGLHFSTSPGAKHKALRSND